MMYTIINQSFISHSGTNYVCLIFNAWSSSLTVNLAKCTAGSVYNYRALLFKAVMYLNRIIFIKPLNNG